MIDLKLQYSFINNFESGEKVMADEVDVKLRIPAKISYFVIFMSVYIASLNSGSNGNCYYVGNDKEAVLIDVGISCREVENRLKRLELQAKKIKAIFISHEHSDHIRGVDVLCEKYGLPVYITEKTYSRSRLNFDRSLVKYFTGDEVINIGNLAVTGFLKKHDAADPHSFVVEQDEVRVGVFTDIGSPCKKLIHHFKSCHAAFLEANYDDIMLERGRYPQHLKDRISGNKGHLSNEQALQLFLKNRSAYLSHLILSHLSADNNSPELVQQTFDTHAGNTQIIVASRYSESEVYQITKEKNVSVDTISRRSEQLTLF